MAEAMEISSQTETSASSQTEASSSSQEETSTSSQTEASTSVKTEEPSPKLKTEEVSTSSQAEASASTVSLKTVIVAMDKSDYCKEAFDYYMKYLRQPTDYLILQHMPENEAPRNATMLVMEPHLDFTSHSQEQTRSLAYKASIELLLRGHGKNGRVELTLGSNPGQEICQLAETSKARMLVLGARGMGIHRQTKLGKVADYVLHHSDVPVVIFHIRQIDKPCST